MKTGSEHWSTRIYFTTEESPAKCQLWERLMKAVRPVIALNEGHLSPNDIVRFAQYISEGDGRKKEKNDHLIYDIRCKSKVAEDWTEVLQHLRAQPSAF